MEKSNEKVPQSLPLLPLLQVFVLAHNDVLGIPGGVKPSKQSESWPL